MRSTAPVRMVLSILLSFLLHAHHATSTNTLKFLNRCPHALYFWPVLPSAHEANAAYTEVPPNGGIVTHTMHTPGGVSVKFRDLPRYVVAPAGILQAEYNLELEQGTLWYDFSAIDCDKEAGPESPAYCPFLAGGVRMYIEGKEEECKVAQCMGPRCERTYLEHGSWAGEPSWSCGAGSDVVVETCVMGPAPKTFGEEIPVSLPPFPTTPPPALHSSSSPLSKEPSITNSIVTEPIPTNSGNAMLVDMSIPQTVTLDHGTNGPLRLVIQHEPVPTVTITMTTTVTMTGLPTPALDIIPRSSGDSQSTWTPPIYPIPSSFPDSTICFDEQCICYGSMEPGFNSSLYPTISNCQEGVIDCFYTGNCLNS